MSREVLADTGPLYAALDPDDTWHARATDDLSQLNAGHRDIVVLCSTLLEAYSLVLYRLGRRIAWRRLKKVVSQLRLVNPLAEDYHAARVRLGSYADQPMSLVDTVLAVMSERLSLPVWTFDHHFDVLRVAVWRPGT